MTAERLDTTLVSAPPTEMPVPVVYWPYYRYGKWVVSGFMVLWTLVLWYLSPGNRRFMESSFYMFFFPMQLYVTTSGVRQVLANGVLSIVRTTGTVQHVPLAAAEIERTVTAAVRFRWTEGRRARSVAVNASSPFLNEVKRASVAARSAAPACPTTEAAAAQAVTFGFPPPAVLRIIMTVLALMTFCLAAMWLEQPLVLLPIAIIALFIDRKATNYMLMLSGEHLWVLTPGQAPHPIPLTAVHHISDGIQTVVITTSVATYPQISASGYRSADLLKQLKHRLQ